VAEIAADHLTPAAAAQVKELLGKQTMADVAVWADDYRENHRETAPWHYVDIPAQDKDYLRERDCPVPRGLKPGAATPWRDCAVDRILYFEQQLADAKTTRAQKVFALKFLIHIVGDLHQPLHAMGEARGGNAIVVTLFGATKCGDWPCNLHWTWDIGLIEHTRLDEKQYVAKLETQIAQQKLADLPPATPVDWANASHRAALAAWVPDGTAIGQQYFDAEVGTLDRALELGGLHLADVLNAIFVPR